MKNNQPIGVFDSGIGGTSIWKEIHELMPTESTIYLADSKNAPYGEKSEQEIIDLSIKNTELLLSFGCKMIVVACNTATTNAIKVLRDSYTIPFIGIEPAIKPAALSSMSHTIGVLATQGTITSELFSKAVQLYSDTRIIEQIGYGLVPLIESGNLDSEETHSLLIKYLNPMVEQKIDYLVLGCSHYPYLIPQIRKIIPDNIKIIDSGQAVAQQIRRILSENDGFSDGRPSGNVFYTNSDTKVLSSFLGPAFTVLYKDF